MLLAFFILLNAISTREEVRSRAVMNSLISTFRSTVERSRTAEIFVSTLGPTPTPEELLEEVERLWVTAIPVTRVEVLTPGRAMQMVVPANKLYPGGEVPLRKDREDLIRNVARVLSTHPPGFVNELEIVLGSEDVTPESLKGKGGRLPLARAVEFAESLVAAGAPPDTISVGVRPGDRRRVRLRFYVRREGRARIDFEELLR